MPGMDKTGPLGTGPIGRGLGPCGGGQLGRGRRGKFGGGRNGLGRGLAFAAQTDEKEILQQQKNILEDQLSKIKQHLQDLEK